MTEASQTLSSSDRSVIVQPKESSIDQPFHDEAGQRSTRSNISLEGEFFWSIADIIYGVSVAGIALCFIPIKTSKLPAVPYTLIAFGALTALIGALTLWSARHLGDHRGARRMVWRVNLTLTTLIASSGLLLTALCLMSGLYWLGVFGVLGWGVFISSLLLLSGVIQLLVLYPLLKLRRILSAPYREHFRGGQVAVRSIQALMVCIMSAGCIGAYAGSLSELESLSDSQRDAVTSYLRATLEGSPITPAGEALSRDGVLNTTISAAPRKKKRAKRAQADGASQNQSQEPAHPLAPLRGVPLLDTLYVSFYAGGERIARVSGRGYDLASATENAARALAAHPKLNGKRLRGGRLVVDRVVGSALIPLTSVPVVGPLILSLSVDPGRDGIRGTAQGATRTLLASDLVEGERFAVAPIIPGIPELRFGLDARFIEQRIGDLKRTRIERLRAEQWVERDEPQNPEEAEAIAQRRATLVERGEPLPARTTLTRRAYWGGGDLEQPLRDLEQGEHRARELLLSRRVRYREAAHLAGAYLTRHQNEDGRFDYQYFPYRDEVKQPPDARYSIPRHSGAIYGLSMLYGDQPKPEYEQTARRAVDWLAQYVEPECGGWTPEVSCIPKISSRGQETRLGDNALTALALLKYLEVIEDSRAERIARGLLHFLSRVQRADGDFHHKYLLYDDSVVPEERGMFASEQAAFAFVLAAKRWPDGPWRARAQRALDALTVHKYGHDFLSSFFYGADHWTCLAANAAYPILKRREYLDFCLGYARFLQRLQYRYDLNEGDLSYHGHYGFGFLSPPQAPATGGFTEGVMGSLLLAESHGVSPESLSDIYAQVSASVEALTHDQVKRAGGWAMKRLDRAEGAFRRSLVESEVRVDFVQHSLSALLMIQQLQTALSSRATLP